MEVNRLARRLGAGLFLLLYLGSCVQLGRWQLHRLEERRAWNQQVTSNLESAPLPAEQLLSSPTPRLEWRRVSMTGTFDPSQQIVIRGRYHEGRYGYEVLTPLRPPSGPALLVDRGWVPAGASATTPPEVPAPPSGTVTVEGRVRLGDGPSRPGPSGAIIGLPTRAANQIKPQQLAKEIPYPIYNAYIEMTAPKLTSPVAVPKPELSQGPHLAYAIQWFFFALLGAIAPFFYRRISQRSDSTFNR